MGLRKIRVLLDRSVQRFDGVVKISYTFSRQAQIVMRLRKMKFQACRLLPKINRFFESTLFNISPSQTH